MSETTSNCKYDKSCQIQGIVGCTKDCPYKETKINNPDWLERWLEMMCYAQKRIVYDPPIVVKNRYVRIACETPDGLICIGDCHKCRYCGKAYLIATNKEPQPKHL